MIVEFNNKMSEVLKTSLISAGLKSLQATVGYDCTMAYKHCHINAVPYRSEISDEKMKSNDNRS
jgi:hypothetical protein